VNGATPLDVRSGGAPSVSQKAALAAIDVYRWTRASWALKLARDPDTWTALLDGVPVDPAVLDQDALREAQERRLVRLDLFVSDIFTLDEAA
jgi:hypothetical protein